jgi:hypothetical protein
MEEGLASVVLTLAGGETVEVGIIGIDGVVGLPILLGAGTVPGRRSFRLRAPAFASMQRF